MNSMDTWQLVLDAAVTGQCALVVTQLLLSGLRKPWQPPLLLVFIGALWASAAGIFLDLQRLILFATSGVSATFLAIGALRVYTMIITESNPQLSWQVHGRIFWPVPLALAALVPLAFLPESEANALLATGDVDTPQKFHAILPWLISQVLWVIWVPHCLWHIWSKLTQYRIELKQVHSATYRRELFWVSALVGVLALFWLSNALDLLDLFGPNWKFPDPVLLVIEALVVWIPALWGLRQQPGMTDVQIKPSVQETFEESADHASVEHEPKAKAAKKYRHSALGEERANRIIVKLQEAMRKDRLFENPSLSLGMLSNEIGVPRHYLSQAINTCLGETFFEFVNRLRVEAAADLLANTDLPVTEIAIQSGFNSRSSFYNAFRKQLNVAPSQYRSQHK